MHVRDLMTPDVVTIAPDASLKEAARVLIDRKISGMPVVDADGTLKGIVTEGDVLHQESIRHPATSLWSFFKSPEDPALSVSDAMTSNVKSVSPDADHTEAARIMESNGVKRLPVVDRNGRLVGILSRADVLKVFARSDYDIEAEIRADVVERVLWLEPGSIDVSVTDGAVTLAGQVPAKTDARILEEMARRIDGTVSVDSSGVSFQVDDTKRAEGPLSGDVPRPNW